MTQDEKAALDKYILDWPKRVARWSVAHRQAFIEATKDFDRYDPEALSQAIESLPDPGQTPCPICEANAKRVEELEAALREATMGAMFSPERNGRRQIVTVTWWEDEMPNLAKWLKENNAS